MFNKIFLVLKFGSVGSEIVTTCLNSFGNVSKDLNGEMASNKRCLQSSRNKRKFLSISLINRRN